MKLIDNIEQYKDTDDTGVARYHTPGHKGRLQYPLDSIAPYDVTELSNTGSLFDGDPLFTEIEEAYESYYKAGASLLSAGGCTLAIQTMIALYCGEGDSVIFCRNAHRSCVSVAALLGLSVNWLYPDVFRGTGLAGTISSDALINALDDAPNAKTVVITSPDYFGCCCDIRAFSKICEDRGVALLVDNAHGSHLIYFGRHPMTLGATACADSLHKTMPVMTGGAVLHLKDSTLKERARRLMPLFGSTSPSYPILLSLGQCAERLSEIGELYTGFADEVRELKEYGERLGVLGCDCDDPLRIVLRHNAYEGEAAEILSNLKIAPEMLKDSHIILLCSPYVSLKKVYLLCNRLARLAKNNKEADKKSLKERLLYLPKPQKAMEVRKAMLGKSEWVALENIEGRVAAEVIAPCPPGIPICIPGEIIDNDIIFLLKKYSFNGLFVVQ